MNTIEIPERKLKFHIPEHLGECNSKEYVDMCELLHRYGTGELGYEQLRFAAIYRFLNMVPKKGTRPEEEQMEVDTNVYRLSELIDGFFNISEEGIALRQEYQHNPIPQIVCATTTLQGPKDHLQDVTFGQYVDALHFFASYNAFPEVETLRELASIFYRKKGSKYNAEKTEKYAKKLKHTGIGYLYGFYLFFASFQHYLTSAAVFWEAKEYDFSILFKSTDVDDKNTPDLPLLGMKSTAFQLAQTGILGNLKDVNNTNLWEVLFLMYDVRVKDIESRRAAKKQENGNS